jgi:prepilin-type N-terminal cleavage/methylation domain-containing protein
VNNRGYSLLEVLMAVSIVVTIGGAAVPLAHGSVERSRVAGAASYVAGRLAVARMEAVRRSAHVAFRFVQTGDKYFLRSFVDGNANGVLTRDIATGVDPAISAEERLDHHFSGIAFCILPDVSAIERDEPLDASDPIQIGPTSLVSFNPAGSSTSGTLFVCRASGNQFAVRILGITGRSRVFRFDFGNRQWRTR